MLSRRAILGLLSGALAWLTGSKLVVAEKAFVPVQFPPERIPSWCPKGWMPVMGQKLTKEQYPFLFTVREQGPKKNFVPIYYGLNEAVLPKAIPVPMSDLKKFGWLDNLTQVPRKEPDDRVDVLLISTEPQVWTNGKVSPAGMHTNFAVHKKDFEDFYGTIPAKPSGPSIIDGGEAIAYQNIDGYQPIVTYVP